MWQRHTTNYALDHLRKRKKDKDTRHVYVCQDYRVPPVLDREVLESHSNSYIRLVISLV